MMRVKQAAIHYLPVAVKLISLSRLRVSRLFRAGEGPVFFQTPSPELSLNPAATREGEKLAATNLTNCCTGAKSRRGAAGMPDLIVGGVLTLTLITTLATYTARASRLMIDTRHAQFAVTELANQMDQLLALDDDARDEAISNLKPSTETIDVLHGASLVCQSIDDALGKRIELRLNWNRTGKAKPMRLTGWISPPMTDSAQ